MPRRRALLTWSAAAVALATVVAPGTAAAGDTTASRSTAAAAFDEHVLYEVVPAVTTDPLSLDAAPDGRLVWTQRDGTVWVLTPEGVQVRAGQLPVSANLCPTCLQQDEGETLYHNISPVDAGVAGLEEGGLHSVLLAEDFATSGRVYLYRSMPGSRNPGPGVATTTFGTKVPPTFGVFRLSTFVLSDLNLLDTASEKVVLEVPVEWDHCCHYGGQLNHMPDGTITLSTGDDNDFRSSSGYGPRDFRAVWNNGELSSANPADRRGKVLRFLPDGSVPDGTQAGVAPNPFVGHEGWNPYIPDTSGTPGDGWVAFDPLVYALGFKQPWRGTVHPSGTLLIDDVGPDAVNDDPQRGPRGFEEINAVPAGGGGHYGWPRCMADNLPYKDVDWATLTVKGTLDCSATAPVSRPLPGAPVAVARSGMTGAAFAYDRRSDNRFPALGSGGLTAQPIAVYPRGHEGALALPDRYADRLITLEYSRNIIYTIPTTADGSLVLTGDAVERLEVSGAGLATGAGGQSTLINPGMNKPIDGVIGADGALYLLEYGTTIYGNPNSRLSRIRCADCTAADPARDYGVPAPRAAAAAPASRLPGGSPLLLAVGLVALAPLTLLGPLRNRRRVL